jgi:hypothetical protein
MTLPEAGEALDDGEVEAPHAAAGDVAGHELWAVVDVEVMAGETAAVPDCMPVANAPADGEVEAGAIRAPGLTRGGW